MKCVYAFELSNKSVKIGNTGNVALRISQISKNYNVNVLNFHHTVFSENHRLMYSIEKSCHKTFADKCIEGEFFNITFAEACREINKYNIYIEESNMIEKIIQRAIKAINKPPASLDIHNNCELFKTVTALSVVKELFQTYDLSVEYLLGLSEKPQFNAEVKKSLAFTDALVKLLRR